MDVNLDRGALVELITARATSPVLSICLRTDPRDPANGRATPAWRTELTTGLNDVAAGLEGDGERDHRLAFRELHRRLPSEIEAAAMAAPGRSMAWFVALDGSFDARYTLQLPLRYSMVRLDERPSVAPLVDVVERGAPVGVVLVGQDRVRVLECRHGRVDESADLELEIDQSDWRPYQGAAGSARHRHTVGHEAHVAAREDAHRDRFFAAAAGSVAAHIENSSWDRVLLVASDGLAPRFHVELPAPVQARVRADLDLNLLGLAAEDVADRLEPHFDALRHDDALALADDLQAAAADAALGPAAVLAALAKHRVDTLLVDPLHAPDLSATPPVAHDVLDGAEPSHAAERAVAAALESNAGIITLSVAESRALAGADGMMAALRW